MEPGTTGASERPSRGCYWCPERWRAFKRRCRWSAGCVFGLALLVGLAGWYLTRPELIRQAIEAELHERLGARVRVGHAELSLGGQIVVRDLTLLDPDQPPQADRLLEVPQVTVAYSVSQWFRERQLVERVILHRPRLYLSRDAQTGRFHLPRALRMQRPRDRQQPTATVPPIYLERGEIHLGEVRDQAFHALGSIAYSGSMQPIPGQPDRYRFRIRTTDIAGQTTGAHGPAARGYVDLSKLRFAMQIEGFTLDGPQQHLLPEELRRVYQRFNPRGSLPTLRLASGPRPGRGLQAELRVHDVALDLPHKDFDFQISGVNGTFSAVGRRVAFDLAGSVQGLNVQLAGEADQVAQLERFPFDVSLRIDGTIPRDPPYLESLPEPLRVAYRRIEPSGPFRARLRLSRDADQATPSVTGEIELLGIRARSDGFLYWMNDLTGRVVIQRDHARLEDLRWVGDTGARFTINGRVIPEPGGSAMRLDVVGKQVPIDDTLIDALDPKRRPLFEMFLHKPSHQRLLEYGVIQTSAQKRRREQALRDLRRQAETDTPDEALAQRIQELERQVDIPVFDLGGEANVRCEIHRPGGPGQEFRTTVWAELTGLNMLCKFWPYPLPVDGGTLVIEVPDAARIENATAAFLNGGHGRLHGPLNPDPEGGLLVPELDLELVDLPADEMLEASVLEPHDRWLRAMELRGRLSGTGRVFKAGDEIDFQVAAKIHEATANPFGGAVHLTDLHGAFDLRRGEVHIRQLQGQHNTGPVRLSSRLSFPEQAPDAPPTSDGDPQDAPATNEPRFTLDLDADGLRFSVPLTDVIPPHVGFRDDLRQQQERFRPEGVFDLELDYDSAHTEASPLHAVIRPATLSFDYGGERIELSEMTGHATVDGQRVQLHQVAGRFDEEQSGSLRVDGMVETASPLRADVRLSAENRRLDRETRALLPEGLLSTLDSMSVAGAYRLDEARLVYQAAKPSEGARPTYTFRGPLTFRDASLDLGIPVDRLDGTLSIDARGEASHVMPWLDLRLDASKLRANYRPAQDITAQAVSDPEDPNRVVLKELRGQLCDGDLMGQGGLLVGEQTTRYRSELHLQNADLDAVANPAVYPDEAVTAPREPSEAYVGRVDASLSLSGVVGEVEKTRGRGKLHVREAELYRLPLAQAVLQILNLQLPTADSFNQADVNFLIDGQTYHFDRIRVQSPTVVLAGKGQMVGEQGDLDVRLVTRGNRARVLGPIDSVVGMIRDELLQIHITGTLDSPETKLESFKGIGDTLESVFDAENARAGKDKDQDP